MRHASCKPAFTCRRYHGAMRITPRQIGLAAVVLFAPGGFILGATLVADHYRRRRAQPAETGREP